jgi:hypothetical protein
MIGEKKVFLTTLPCSFFLSSFPTVFGWRLWVYHGWPGIPQFFLSGEEGKNAYDYSDIAMWIFCFLFILCVFLFFFFKKKIGLKFILISTSVVFFFEFILAFLFLFP